MRPRRGKAVFRTLLVLSFIIAGVAVVVAQGNQRLFPGNSSSAEAVSPAEAGTALDAIRESATPLADQSSAYDPLVTLVGDGRFVLLGEATHGTHEFYRERARISRRLIEEKGFTAIAIEGDWTDADRVNRYVRGLGEDTSAEQALEDFDEFPVWMWRNKDMRELVEWLREYNETLPAVERVGFYGLDLYGVIDSAEAVVEYLAGVDVEAAKRARERYHCFSRFGDDLETYGRKAAADESASCERGALEQLQELERRAASPLLQGNFSEKNDLFSALQNARVVQNGEAFFRTLFTGESSTWNLRDQHMTETLEAVATYFDRPGKPARVVAWAHNSHMGDVRATEIAASGEWNIGQLMRERYGDDAILVGFTTYTGTVWAASTWGEAGQRMDLQPALESSYGALFHDTGLGDFLLVLRGNGELADALGEQRLERAVGVLYLPRSERFSHYFRAALAQQFDAVIHIDETRAIEPLEH